jgi:hypothetical protein
MYTTASFPVGSQATLPSGNAMLTGTVTRTTDSSVWVSFDGNECRFGRSQDGQFRRYGRTADQHAPVLVPVPPTPAAAEDSPVIQTAGYEPIGDAELDALLAPTGWDMPPAGQDLDELLEPLGFGKPITAVTRIEFTPQQANVADRIERVVALTTGWGNDDEEARRKVQTDFLSSFRIEPLIVAAGRQEPLTWMRAFLGRIEDAAVISERGRVLELLDPAKAADQLEKLCGNAQDRFESWYKPNSTSNVDVEIKLAEHEAWQSLYRVATGKRFY